MESATVERVTEWESVPFSGGYAGLRDLADREFSGAVSDGGAWMFMLNGRVVGVFDGRMEQFEDAEGTAYRAPHPSLPLLFAMRETGGETRAKYYTEDTPFSEVDRTLKAGNFTGYVELSENVLSGDYYTVYHGGKAMSAAFVGNNRRLLTDDEAFDRADDEVGIYEVRTVDVDVVDVPEPETPADDGASGGTDATTGAGAAGAGAAASASADDSDSATDADGADGSDESTQGGVTFGGEDPLADDGAEAPPSTSAAADDGASPTESDDASPTRGGDAEGPKQNEDARREDSKSASSPSREAEQSSSAADRDDPLAESTEPPAADDDPLGGSGTTSEPTDVTDSSGDEPDRPDADAPREQAPVDRSVFDDETEWRDSRSIPALDPDDTADAEAASGAAGAAKSAQSRAQRRRETQGRSRRREKPQERSEPNEPSQPDHEAADGASRRDRQRHEAESALENLRAERERLAARIEELEGENDGLREEHARLRREREEAANRVASLETEVAELESTIRSLEAKLADAEETVAAADAAGDDAGDATRDVPVDRAFEGTNLFVRYRRKSGATLDDAYDGTESREAVNENLRLEHHTDFDAADVAVDGRPFDEWLEETIEFGFSRWLVEEFIHDVRETRNQSSLEKLYESVPDIDRVEFRGVVDVPTREGSETRTFDVVLRDRMGDPLVVADLNDSREPATEEMLSSLVENATPVGEVEPALAGAFYVTTSYYEPGALETAHEATGGGLLRRERRKSFVKLSRKEGYHLCLVETRNGEFHLNVPEL